MHNLTINLLDERENPTDPIPNELIHNVLQGAYSTRSEMAGAVNILIIDDQRIAEMNETYLNHQGATDVLAFDDGDIEDDILLLGDIAVSADTAKRLGSENGMSFDQELTLYTLHGLLHLLGMDDKDEAGCDAMMQAQEKEFIKHGLTYNR